MEIKEYIKNIAERYKLGNSTEHTFRGDLQQLIESIVPTIRATNEPKRQECGAPDYILTKGDIPVGFIEAKDIGDSDLAGNRVHGNKEQFDRYKKSLNNLIFTDYIEFYFYREGEFVQKLAIGELIGGKILPLKENFDKFIELIKDFCLYKGTKIKSSKKLSEMMAGKAKLLSEIIENALNSEISLDENSTLKDQMQAFKEILIHDITPKGFADVYAQTIVYGLFAARLNDTTLESFSRREASELIPKSNPFLRKLFNYIAGPDIDDRICWVVDSLAEIFAMCNVREILREYGKTKKMEDPIIHFYEDFLSEYDPKLRKARGVWYTPAPVVNFIVRSVDEILRNEFGLSQGLADSSKTVIKTTVQGKKSEQEVHKVQILDTATGTGTFLAEVIKHVREKFNGQEGLWSSYVDTHLIPRLNGFELLMASYAMAHLKLHLLLEDTGYKATKEQRLKVYLTNSLEEYHPDTGTLFANWLSTEANEANHIKRDTPVMCIIGNPPYSVSSTNKGEWIQKLIADYKKDLNERKINLDDDYIKFIRYGQHYVDKNGSGILAYVSNNSFIDGITHRQMRKNLLESFDKIYILDLHGSSKKSETALDGSKDENIFDIQQGVSVNIFIKTSKKKSLGEVFYSEFLGKRAFKYENLLSSDISSINWKKLEYDERNFFFTPKDFNSINMYEKGFRIDELFNYSNSGIQTKNDELTIHYKLNELRKILEDFKTTEANKLREKYNIRKDGRDWRIDLAKSDIFKSKGEEFIIQYKPFDFRYSYYTGNSKGFLAYPRKQLTDTILKGSVALATMRQIVGSTEPCQALITKFVLTDRAMYSTNGTPYLFPLYLYNNSSNKTIEQTTERTPNLNIEIINQIAEKLGLIFTTEKETTENTFSPIDILDYIYAVLHSPSYRERYKEFLKIDFPRVPYPKNRETFWKLVELGGELRRLHLMESKQLNTLVTRYPVGGDNSVSKVTYLEGKVYINETQYFDGVSETAWNFYIGGYQPAQKWLKDRKNRTLEFDDIIHYQKIIVILNETARIMKLINEIEIE